MYIAAFRAHLDLNMGRWDKAAREAAELLERHALAVAQRIPALFVLAAVRARRGDPGVDPLLDEAARLARPTGEFQRIGRIAATRAEVAWYRGDLEGVAREAAIGLNISADHPDPWLHGELSFWAHVADPAEGSRDFAEPYVLMIGGDWEGAAAAWRQLGAPYERALALSTGPQDALREALANPRTTGGRTARDNRAPAAA